MHKNGIINNRYTEVDTATSDSYQVGGVGAHTHDSGSLSVCMLCTYRTTDMHTHLSTLVWCLQKPKIWSSYNCLSKKKKDVASSLSFESNEIIPRLLITRI